MGGQVDLPSVAIKEAVENAVRTGRTRLSPLLEARFESQYRKLLAVGYPVNPPPEMIPIRGGGPSKVPHAICWIVCRRISRKCWRLCKTFRFPLITTLPSVTFG
jgi:hypothetical protein